MSQGSQLVANNVKVMLSNSIIVSEDDLEKASQNNNVYQRLYPRSRVAAKKFSFCNIAKFSETFNFVFRKI